MSAIHDLLSDLRRLQGVVGAMVVTPDGMSVAADLHPRFEEDAVAGLTSFVVSTTNRALADMQSSSFRRFTMHTTHGKVVINDGEGSWLVVITDQFTNLSSIAQELDDAVRQLRRISRISV